MPENSAVCEKRVVSRDSSHWFAVSTLSHVSVGPTLLLKSLNPPLYIR